MKKVLVVLFTLVNSIAFSQDDKYIGSLTGKVIEIQNSQPIAGVVVRILDSKLGALSNENGVYSIKKIPAGTYTVEYKRIGYGTVRRTDVVIRSGRSTDLDVELSAVPITTEEVTVKAEYFSEEITQSVSTVQLTNEEIRRAPGSFGDISRIIAGLPSTAKVDDQSNALIVRGGSPIENAFYVDNIEITNINHFPSQGTSAGGTSIIPVDLVSSAEFSAGGFSSLFGDKLSSVMNINLRNGNKENFNAQIDLNVIGFGGIIEGPFASGKGTYIVAARRSYLDLIAEASGINLLPSFGDAQIKLTYDIDNNNFLSILGILSDDHISSDSANAKENKQTAYGSDDIYDGTIGLNWKHLWGSIGYSNTSFAFTQTSFKNRYLNNESGNEMLKKNSTEQFFRFRNVNTFIPNKFFTIECGVDIKYTKADNDILIDMSSNAFGDTVPPFRLLGQRENVRAGLFAMSSYHINDQIRLSAGFRSEYSTVSELFNFSPKVNVSYKVSERTSATLSYGMYFQGIPLLLLSQNPILQKPKDMKSEHYVLSLQHLLNDETRIVVESYFKNYSGFPVDPTEQRLFAVDEPYDRIGFYTNHSQLVQLGKARSYGVETFLQKKLADNFYCTAGLSWYRAEYAGYDGVWRNRTFDNRFIFSAEGGYTLDKEWELSTRWIYAGGRPYTPFDTKRSVEQNTGVLDENNVNTSRFPPYHSLNIRVDKRFPMESSTIIVYVSVWNVYNRKNTQAVIWNSIDNRPETVNQFGLLPIFGIEWEL